MSPKVIRKRTSREANVIIIDCIVKETAMDKKEAIAQIDRAIERYAEVSRASEYDDCSDLPDSVVSDLISTLAATIERVAPADGHHRKILDKLIEGLGPANPVLLRSLPGLLESLKRDWFDGQIAGPERSMNEPLGAPEKVTLRWLIDNVGWRTWVTLFGLIAGGFLFGVRMGQLTWVRDLLHEPVATVSPSASAPTGSANTSGTSSPANTGNNNAFTFGDSKKEKK